MIPAVRMLIRRVPTMIPAALTLIPPTPTMIPVVRTMIKAMRSMIRAAPTVVREVEGFVYGNEIEVGAGADDCSRGIGQACEPPLGI